jgi:hypothetical protein
LVLASLWLLAETDTGFGYPITLSPDAVVTKRLPDTMYTLSNSPGSQEIAIAFKTLSMQKFFILLLEVPTVTHVSRGSSRLLDTKERSWCFI